MRAAVEKMRAAGAHPEAIRAFQRAYERLESGETTMLPSAELEPVGDVPSSKISPACSPAIIAPMIATFRYIPTVSPKTLRGCVPEAGMASPF